MATQSDVVDANCAAHWFSHAAMSGLTGEHPVLDWITGTALTPVKGALAEEDWQRFRSELIPRLAESYPPRLDGRTFFPFRRIFVVAQVG